MGWVASVNVAKFLLTLLLVFVCCRLCSLLLIKCIAITPGRFYIEQLLKVCSLCKFMPNAGGELGLRQRHVELDSKFLGQLVGLGVKK